MGDGNIGRVRCQHVEVQGRQHGERYVRFHAGTPPGRLRGVVDEHTTLDTVLVGYLVGFDHTIHSEKMNVRMKGT